MDLISKQIQGVLENTIFNQVLKLNLGVSNVVLKRIISRVAEESAVIFTRSVNLSANQQLNTIPGNLLGPVNPVNLVSGNLGSAGVNSALNNTITTQLSSQLTDKVITALESQLKIALPASARNIISFPNLAAVLTQSITPTVNSAISTALGGFTNGIFNRGTSNPPVLSNITQLFGVGSTGAGGIGAALSQLTRQFSTTTANKYLGQAKSFSIDNTSNREKLIANKKGFIDPDANYPTKEYAGLSETNKLAQGDVRGTIVQSKNQSRLKGAKLPGNEAWDQPESPFKGQYPYNKVTQTEGGHIIEIDDTPGSERLHVYHKSGTFIEIDATGSVVKRAVGSSYEIIDRNGKISIAGRADISVNGDCNLYVGNNATIEVDGDTTLTCHNDITAQAGGTLNLSATEELNITSANVNIQAYNLMNVTSNVALNLHSTDTLNMRSNANVLVYTEDYFFKSNSDSFIQVEGNHHNKVKGDYRIAIEGDYNNKVTGDIKNQSGGQISNQASGDFTADGDNIHLNSGNSVSADTAEASKEAKLAGISNIGILEGRKDIIVEEKEDPVALTIKDEYALRLEEENPADGEYAKQKDLIVLSGFSSIVDFESTPVKADNEDVSSEQADVVIPDEKLKEFTEIPGNYNISPNFTVEMLSSKAAITKDFITTTEKIKFGEVLYNLQAVALNILEPAYNLIPDLTVASGYRSAENSSQNSVHPLGQAVDIQFTGYTDTEYYEAAKQLARVLNYDQFILEYCSYTNSSWIHISYLGSNNRKEVMTFWNNKKYDNGLYLLR